MDGCILAPLGKNIMNILSITNSRLWSESCPPRVLSFFHKSWVENDSGNNNDKK